MIAVLPAQEQPLHSIEQSSVVDAADTPTSDAKHSGHAASQDTDNTVTNGIRQYCTFTLNGFLFGIDVACVQEVIRYQPMTDVPLAHPVVRGLINLRGQIVTALDLRRRLDLPERLESDRPMNIVVRIDDTAVSFLVDDIGDVVEVDGSLFEPPPQTLRGAARSLILGAHKLHDRLLLVLDTARAIELSDS